jgi:trk system potassium uptake protein TrkH
VQSSPPDLPERGRPAAPAGAARPRRSWTRAAALLLGTTLILGLDVALAVTAWISAALTAFETLLVPMWIVAILVQERRRDARGRRDAGKARVVALVLGLGLLVACVAEKWLLLIHAGEGDPGRVVALYRAYTLVAFAVANAGLLGRRPIERLMVTAAEHPARLMVLSFGLAALLGSFLLTLPQSLHDMADASFVDGLFMAMSAVCVTGLAVHNVAETYTPIGQLVLVLLIQVGGLGIMVLSTFFAIVAGRRLRLRDAVVMAEMIDAESIAQLRRSVAAIMVSTLLIEGAGALALYVSFERYDLAIAGTSHALVSGHRDRGWAAVFHAVSAFCNAGFSTFRDGLVPFVGNPAVCGTIMALIVLGGLGFPVHDELFRWVAAKVARRRPPRLSLHSRVVLITTAILITVGGAGFLALEWSRSMRSHSIPARILAGFFESVMTRTAGFNTLDYSVMGPATWMFVCVLMFIGAGPGSTAGGVKVTTVAVLFSTLRAELRGSPAPLLLGRTIPQATVRRALGVAFLSVLIVCSLLFLLLVLEPHEPLRLAFETVSAFGTVGLSTGITPALSAPGKLTITVAMFIGRIGPLTLAVALANQAAAPSYRLPEERVGIG